MRTVKNRDELAARTGRKPVEKPAPAPAPQPIPAAPRNDAQMVAMQEAIAQMAASMAQLPQMLADAARSVPAPAAPPAPPKRASIFTKPAAPAAPIPAPAPAVVKPAGPIMATIQRDKSERLASVTMSGAVSIKAEVARDGKDRINEMMVERDGVRQRVTFKRNADGHIETATLHPATLT